MDYPATGLMSVWIVSTDHLPVICCIHVFQPEREKLRRQNHFDFLDVLLEAKVRVPYLSPFVCFGLKTLNLQPPAPLLSFNLKCFSSGKTSKYALRKLRQSHKVKLYVRRLFKKQEIETVDVEINLSLALRRGLKLYIKVVCLASEVYYNLCIF